MHDFSGRSAMYLMNHEGLDEKLPRILLRFNAIKINSSLMNSAENDGLTLGNLSPAHYSCLHQK